MYYELALLSVLVAGAYWGWYFVRRDETLLYGAMQLGAALLAGLGLLGRKVHAGGLGIAGAIGFGAGTCLIVIGPLARGAARRAAQAERFTLAAWLLDLADLLAPGSGVAEDKALVAGMRELRSGNIQPALDQLAAHKERAPDDVRLAIDERISVLYLSAGRWDDAIAHAEANLFSAAPPEAPVPADQPLVALYFTLRNALGCAPQVWIELLGAYGYKGDLEQAARMLARLEDACEGHGQDATRWLHRARMMFLAHAGRVAAVEALVDPSRAPHLTRSKRSYWLAVAHERRGDRAAAEAAYARARTKARGQPRLLIDQAIARLPDAHAIELGPAAAEVVARVEATPPPVVERPARPRRRWATWSTTVALLAAAGAIALAFGDSTDLGVVLRGGAMARGLIRAGEWWRLVSCVFVHVGGLHLASNVIALWFIGRIAEDMFGGVRTLAVFALAGLAGSVASFLASPAGVSAGASGAIFGLLGAVFVEVTVHRARYRAAWSRSMWGMLALVAVLEIAVGFMYPVIDQWAHGAGLAVGALAGLALSPGARWSRITRPVAWAISGAFAAAALVAAVQVARTPLAASLAAGPRATFAVNGLAVTAPATWRAEAGDVFDPDDAVSLELHRALFDEKATSLDAEIEAWASDEERRAKDNGFDRIARATDHVIPLPAGWQGRELEVSAPRPDPIGGRQHFRVLAAGRRDGDRVVLVSLYAPETVARGAPAFFTRLLASVR